MKNTLAPSGTSLGLGTRMDPSEIFKEMDKVRDGVRAEPEPSFLEQLFSKDKREHARLISQAKSEGIRARKELIQGLANTVKTYVDVHVDDLIVRGHAHVIATFGEMSMNLERIATANYVAALDNYAWGVEKIKSMPHLSDEMREEQIGRMRDRVKVSQDKGDQTFQEILDAFASKVKDIADEIGRSQ